ncbi:MAG TPA: TIGR03086 family metal-binding protein [Streptosporangiaceae bacterium]|nr:TIGR03086 family metal-binding protein [Streptosporangiaceae bacterium]
MAALTSGLSLIQSAVGYAVTAAGPATTAMLAEPTPCGGWDLELLLAHVADSMDVLTEAIAAGSVGSGKGESSYALGESPVESLHRAASRLLAACADPESVERVVVIGDRRLAASVTAVTGALEITVHGWDIAAACRTSQPVPPGLAVVLLAIAPVLITPAIRPGLFADPVRVPSRCGPGDQLVAFLGRHPRRPAPHDAA